MSSLSFADLGLDAGLVTTLDSLGIRQPTPIQAQAIPLILEGIDLVGLSQTGSGKTAAFGLPLIQNLDAKERYAQGLIICPTRELAVQVGTALTDFARSKPGLRGATLYGGAAMDKQVRDLRGGAQVIVGTPGRVLDHLKRGTLKPDQIKYVVLDEADRMLDMGFREEMEAMLEQLPEERQTLFFSATMNKHVERLIKKYGKEPQKVEFKSEVRTADTVTQGFYDLRWPSKREVICRLLELETPRLTIVFCNTKKTVDECSEALQEQGFPADRIHGDMNQPMRERVMNRFRDGQISILIATDVAARGLDIDNVDLVINFDLPGDPEDYVHRIGRTGRAGRSGRAVSLVAQREHQKLRTIERYAKMQIEQVPVPGRKDLERGRAKMMLETLRSQLGEEGETEALPDFDALGEEFDWKKVASTLFGLWCDASMRDIQPIPEDGGKFKERRRDDTRREREPRDRRERDRDRGPRRERDRDRGDRDSRVPSQASPPPPGKRRVFIGLGKVEKIRPGELIGMLYNESGIPDGAIGQLHLFPRHSLVDVDEEFADKLVHGSKNARFRGRAIRIRFDDRS